MKRIRFKFSIDRKFKDFPFTGIYTRPFNDEIDYNICLSCNGTKTITL